MESTFSAASPGATIHGSARVPADPPLRRVLTLSKADALRVLRKRLLTPTSKRIVLAVAVALLLLLLNDTFLYESVLIPSASMEPTILPNERAFLQKFSSRPLARFDLVVIDSRTFGHRVVKRVIALPGERVRVEDSWKVFVNGRSLGYSDETAGHARTEAGSHLIRTATDQRRLDPPRFANQELQLGPDEFFVLGDNRLASHDSRATGPVQRREIQGVLGTVWYSYDLQQGRLRSERMLRSPR